MDNGEQRTDQEYEYGGLMAATWDLFRGDTSRWADRFFYLDLIAEHGQPVLDVGCGTGRLLLDYLSQGVDIDGVDNSPAMLALCQQKAAAQGLQPRLYQQSMETLTLPRLYRLILVPSSSFQLVTDLALARQAMQRFYSHLLPGGMLAMPFSIFWQDGDPLQSDWTLMAEKPRPEDGAILRRWGRARYDPSKQVEHTEDRYEMVVDGEIVASEYHQRSPATRQYTRQQALALYREAGFTHLQAFNEFTHQPAPEEARLFTLVGIKASE